MKKMKKMKKIILGIIAVAGLFLTNTQAQILQGRWVIDKITYEREADGKNETITYYSTEEVKDRIRFPQEIEIKEKQNMILRYFDIEDGLDAEYILEEDNIRILEGPIGHLYSYKMSEEIFTLQMQPFIFTNKLSTGETIKITEQWSFTMKKQEKNNKKN
jgi:hypothetical protein